MFFNNSANLGVLALAWNDSKTSDWVSLNEAFTPHLEKIKRSLDGDVEV